MTPPIGKNNSIATAISTLGITRYEAEQLDRLDGKTDGKIKKDIFTQAQEILASADAQGKEDRATRNARVKEAQDELKTYLNANPENADSTEVDKLLANIEDAKNSGNKNSQVDLSSTSAVHKAMGASIATRAGFESYVFRKNGSEPIENDTPESDIADDIEAVSRDADEHYAEHGTIQGFNSEDVPNDVSNINIQHEQANVPTGETYTYFDANGQGQIAQQKEDVNVTRTNYTANGEEYELGYIWGV